MQQEKEAGHCRECGGEAERIRETDIWHHLGAMCKRVVVAVFVPLEPESPGGVGDDTGPGDR